MRNASRRFGRALATACGLLLLSVSCHAAPEAPDWLAALTKTAPTVSTKDASAVRMLDEGQLEIHADGRRTMRIRTALKILTADGKKHATANVNYLAGSSEVKSFKAWVIKPDGDVTVLGKKELRDIALHASALELYSEARRQVLSAAQDIQPGSWFGFEAVRVERSVFHELAWHFQDDVPTQRSSITVKLAAGWNVVDRTLNHAPIASTGSTALRTWQMTEVPALPKEPMSPAATSFSPYLALDFIPPANSAAARSAVQSGSWLELSRQFTPKYDAASQTDDAMRLHLTKLVAGAATPWDRLQRLCHFAQTVNYISIQLDAGNAGGMIPRPATRVLQCNYGDCKDKANLLCTLLAGAGIKAHPLVVLAGSRDRIEAEWPSPSQFNHVILAIEVDTSVDSSAIVEHPQLGRLLLFDPTDEYTPLGLVASSRLARQGLLLAGEAGGLIELPRAKVESEQRKRTIRAELDGIGNVHATLEEEFAGLASSAARSEFSRLKKDDFQKRIERRLGDNLPALRGTKVESVDGFPKATFTLRTEFSSFGYGKTMRDELLIFKPVLVARHDTVRLPKKERKLPVALRANAFEERAEFVLPEGYVVNELPRTVRLETDFGRYQMQARHEAGKVFFERSLVMQSVEVPAADYEKVRAFFEKVHQSEQSPVVLRRAAGPAPAEPVEPTQQAGPAPSEKATQP